VIIGQGKTNVLFMQRDPHIRRVIAMEITSWAETAFNKISKIIITERHVRLYANALE